MALCTGAALCALRIKTDDIDFGLACGADQDDAGGNAKKEAAPGEAAGAPSGSVWDGIREMLAGFRDLLT